MNPNHSPATTRLGAALLLTATLAVPFGLLDEHAATARAALPVGEPAFGQPTNVTNEFWPHQAGAIRVYSGRDHGDDITIVEFHLSETRTFEWRGNEVECVTIRESQFVDGDIEETSLHWFAQADDGSVWAFGEAGFEGLITPDDDDLDDDDDDDDDDTDDPSESWVVGAVDPSDPPGTLSATDPFLLMPANPESGDEWKPEDLGDAADETNLLLRTNRKVKVPGGRFRGCLEVQGTSGFHPGREIKWYAPGVGVVKSRSRGEKNRLLASTLGTR